MADSPHDTNAPPHNTAVKPTRVALSPDAFDFGSLLPAKTDLCALDLFRNGHVRPADDDDADAVDWANGELAEWQRLGREFAFGWRFASVDVRHRRLACFYFSGDDNHEPSE